MKRCALLLMAMLLCGVNTPSQSNRRVPTRKSAVVVFQRTESGNREGAHYLRLNGNVKSFHWGSWTRFNNFHKPQSRGREWVEGAEWRIVNSEVPTSERSSYDYSLWSATFTGRTVPSNLISPSSNEDWNTFWIAFSAAVRSRDRAALKRMLANPFLCGGATCTPDEWIADIDLMKLWPQIQKSVASGLMPVRSTERNRRYTKDGYIIFELGRDGRWRWIEVPEENG